MARKVAGEEFLESAKKSAAATKSAAELRQALAVILPLEGLSLKKSEEILGISAARISTLRNDFFAGKVAGQKKHGGRRAENLKYAGIKGMQTWISRVKSGEKTPKNMQMWLKRKLQRPVPLSSVYMILHRNGWGRAVAAKNRGRE